MIAQRLLKTFTSGQAALTRSMSMWSSGFEDPIPHKNEIKNAKVTGRKIFFKTKYTLKTNLINAIFWLQFFPGFLIFIID